MTERPKARRATHYSPGRKAWDLAVSPTPEQCPPGDYTFRIEGPHHQVQDQVR